MGNDSNNPRPHPAEPYDQDVEELVRWFRELVGDPKKRTWRHRVRKPRFLRRVLRGSFPD